MIAFSALVLALAGSANVQTPPASPQAPILTVHHEAADDATPAQMLTSIPSDTWPVTDWYGQSIYDRSDNKLGEIMDLLVDHGGKNVAIIISVGGFLGIGDKDVAVPFNAVRFKKKDNTWYPVMNTTKETLQSAPGYKYDRSAKTWMPENASGTTGGPTPAPRPNAK